MTEAAKNVTPTTPWSRFQTAQLPTWQSGPAIEGPSSPPEKPEKKDKTADSLSCKIYKWLWDDKCIPEGSIREGISGTITIALYVFPGGALVKAFKNAKKWWKAGGAVVRLIAGMSWEVCKLAVWKCVTAIFWGVIQNFAGPLRSDWEDAKNAFDFWSDVLEDAGNWVNEKLCRLAYPIQVPGAPYPPCDLEGSGRKYDW